MNAPGWADLLLINLGRGRDRAEPLGSLQERLGAPRRALEAAVQDLRLRGEPVASGPDGVWLATSWTEMEEVYRSLRRRIAAQSVTAAAVRRQYRAMRAAEYRQETLWPAA